MTSHHAYFGGRMLVHMETTNDHQEILLDRDVWFDLDIDGRWLVGVSGPDAADEMQTGAIVVRDDVMSHFIETLGRLLADPAEFAGEPVLVGPD
jgi:hypothetical protein